MPAIFINPIDDNHLSLLLKLNKQNQDLRVFISDKLDKNLIEKIPGKKLLVIFLMTHTFLLHAKGLIVEFFMKVPIWN